MAKETVHNPPPINQPADSDDTKSDFGVESNATTTSSSLTCCAAKMASGEIPELFELFKKMTIPKVDVPTIHNSTVVCFVSHFIAGLGPPPSKFLVAIMNYLGCELVHFNLNAIAALSCFIMLCECWLAITPDTSLFWYYYSPA
jgi:hypothetical protein